MNDHSLCIFIIVILLIIAAQPYWDRSVSIQEFFIPVRFVEPVLYPTTVPVNMLMMKKYLLADGYRFQNTLVPPEASNLQMDLPGEMGPLYRYPQNFRQKVGVFKHNAYVEGFASSSASSAGGASSTATMTQLNSHDDQDSYLLGKNGDPIVDSGDNYNLSGRYSGVSPYSIDYIKPFSWDYYVNVFYAAPQSKDVQL